MDLRLIALDLDGTTLNSQGKVSPYTKKILEKALSKGILVVIASGRALSAIPEDILNIRGLKYIITSNGSSIFELPDSRRIYANDMKPGVVMSVLAIMQDTHFHFEVFIGGHAYTMQAYYDCPTDFGVPERMNHYVQTTRTPISAKPLPCMRWLRSFILPRNKLLPLETVITTSIFYLMPDAVSQCKTQHPIS